MSFPHYESYKDSGFEWIGDLPNDWKTDKIKFNTYVKGRVGWHGLNSNEFSDEGVHLVTGTDFDNGFVNWGQCYRISDERYSEDPYIQLRENDLLITKDGTIGKLARVKGLPERASLNSGIFLVRAKNKAYLEDFLYWVLQSSLFVHFMDLRKTGSTIQHLYQEVFNQFAFPIPSHSEQHQICIFLDRETTKIDALIAEQQRLIELLKEKRQAVLFHAVTKGLNPGVTMKGSGIEWLGEVPQHWEIRRVKSVSTFITSGPRGWADLVGEEGELFIQSGDLNDVLQVEFSAAKRVQKGNDAEASRTRLNDGDVVVCITGAKTGNVAICNTVPETAYINQHLCLIRPGNEILPIFLGVLLKSKIGQTYFELAQYGLKQGLSLENIKEALVLLPSSSEQANIVAFLDSELQKLDILTAEAQRGIDLLKERRAALISAAVTGKIDVRGIVAVLPQTEMAA
jgi:type I restriction enzyme S subunit